MPPDSEHQEAAEPEERETYEYGDDRCARGLRSAALLKDPAVVEVDAGVALGT